MKRYNVVGLMSGTSLDGLDMAYVQFDLIDGNWKFEIKACRMVPFPSELRENISSLQGKLHLGAHDKLDEQLSIFFSEKVLEFLNTEKVSVDFISSHGQTMYHSPEEGITIQLGNGKRMSEIVKIPIVSNFREQDLVLGGQGAPLVPIGDKLLFPSFKYCLNLGGIANISVKTNSIVASDIAMCNTALNYYARQEGFDFDAGGKMASTGQKNDKLFMELDNLDFNQNPWPKSLDSTYFYQIIMPIVERYKDISNKDILNTLTHYIANQVNNAVCQKDFEVLVTGGGCHNQFLMNLMKNEFGIKIFQANDKLIDYKEALIFAFLGVLRCRNETNVLASVTGASRDHCAGQIHRFGIEVDSLR